MQSTGIDAQKTRARYHLAIGRTGFMDAIGQCFCVRCAVGLDYDVDAELEMQPVKLQIEHCAHCGSHLGDIADRLERRLSEESVS